MNIIDYCIKNKDKDFKQLPFNYVDSLVLSEFAYCDFDNLFNDNNHYTIRKLAELYFRSDDIGLRIIDKSLIYDSPDILLAMSKSNRYKNCLVYNYVSNLNKENVEQFSALMIDLPDKTTVVCFRGTDDTLIGWHEDLKLSYTLMTSQIKAKEYVNKNCRLFNKYRFVGHSKGGNLALYASVNCRFLLKPFIKQVISNDGPGLRNGTYKQTDLNRILPKYIKIVPEYDIFGSIYDNDENKIVVKSSLNNIMAHNGFSWLIDKNDFIRVSDINEISIDIKNGINDFLNETSDSQKQIMIDEIFNSLYKANIYNVSGFMKGGIPVVFETLLSLSKMNGVAKDTATKLLKVFYTAYEKNLIKKAKFINNEVSQFFNNRIKDVENIFK